MNQGFQNYNNQGFNQNQKSNWDLFTAIWEGNVANVKSLIFQGTNIHVANETSRGYIPLTHAVALAQYEIAIILLEHGANPNTADLNGSTPLILALNSMNLDRRMNAPDQYNILRRKMELLQLLIAKGANVNVEDYYTGKSALNLAIQNGYYQITEMLIEKGADFNHCERRNYTPIMTAIENQNLGIVELLIQHGVSFTTGWNGLELAVIIGNRDIINVLIQYLKSFDGLNVHAHDNWQARKGMTPLISAIIKAHLAIIKILIENGANVNKKDDHHGMTPLMWAIRFDRTHCHEIVKLLIEHGADVNLCDDHHNMPPMHHAIQMRNLEVVKLLYHNGANINFVDDRGFSLLATASHFDLENVVHFFVENGAMINPLDSDHASPINMAVDARNFDIAKYLAMNGACLETKAPFYNPDSPFSGSVFDTVEFGLANSDIDIAKMLIFLKNEQEK